MKNKLISKVVLSAVLVILGTSFCFAEQSVGDGGTGDWKPGSSGGATSNGGGNNTGGVGSGSGSKPPTNTGGSNNSGGTNTGGSSNPGYTDVNTGENGIKYGKDKDGNWVMISGGSTSGASHKGDSKGLSSGFTEESGELEMLLASGAMKGRERTTPFLDRVEFTFKRQGGSMKKGTVEMSKTMALLIKQNPEQMAKYKKAAGKNYINNSWSGSSKLTFNFADTIGVNNYQKIRDYSMNPKNFAPGVYLTNVEKGTYNITAKVYGGAYVDQSKVKLGGVKVYQDRNSNGKDDTAEAWHICEKFHTKEKKDSNGKVIKDKYGNPIKEWTGKKCNLDAPKYYSKSDYEERKDGTVRNKTAGFFVVGSQYYKKMGVATPKIKTISNTTADLTTRSYIYEWWPHLGEQLVTRTHKGNKVVSSAVGFNEVKTGGSKNAKPKEIKRGNYVRSANWIIHVIGDGLTTEKIKTNATVRPTLSK